MPCLTRARAYNELDDVPASVHPMLYQALEDWGYDGFVMADDTGAWLIWFGKDDPDGMLELTWH
jgi:beta-glucosidase-like glycosyl hydrolase